MERSKKSKKNKQYYVDLCKTFALVNNKHIVSSIYYDSNGNETIYEKGVGFVVGPLKNGQYMAGSYRPNTFH